MKFVSYEDQMVNIKEIRQVSIRKREDEEGPSEMYSLEFILYPRQDEYYGENFHVHFFENGKKKANRIHTNFLYFLNTTNVLFNINQEILSYERGQKVLDGLGYGESKFTDIFK